MSVRSAVVAGLVLVAAGASHGQDVSRPAEVRLVPAACFGGPLRPNFGSRADTLVYDNTGGPLLTNLAQPRQVLDDVQLIPGPAARIQTPLLISGIDLAFSVETLGNFDLEVAIYTSINTSAGSGESITSGSPLSSFVIPIHDLPNTGAWQTGPVDLTSLPGGGIRLNGTSLFLRVRYLQPQTTNVAENVTPTFASSWNITDWSSTRSAGRSCSGCFRDVDGDGVLEASEFRTFNFPQQADLFLALWVAAATEDCTADFNQDGAVDFFDYLDFVNAFSVGC